MSDGSTPDVGRELVLVPIEKLVACPHNVRQTRPEGAQKELEESIFELGVLQPILVHPVSGGGYEVIAGWRRTEAARAVGLTEIPAHAYRQTVPPDVAREASIVENLCRADVPAFEEGLAIAQLLDEGLGVPRVAKRIGKTEGFVRRRANLKSLSPKWRAAIKKGAEAKGWTGEMLELIALVSEPDQDDLLKLWGGMSNPRYGNLKQEVGAILRQLKLAPWKLDDEKLHPPAGSCSACPKQSANAPGLFKDMALPNAAPGKEATCLDTRCWREKVKRHRGQALAKAKAEHGSKLVLVQGEWDPAFENPGYGRGGKKVLQDYQYDRSKKDAKGAKPAFVTTGKGTGKVIWITTGKNRSGVSATRKPARPKFAKDTPGYLKERRAALKTRRFAWEVDSVRDQIGEAKLETVLQAKPGELTASEHLLGLCAVYLAGKAYERRGRSVAKRHDLNPQQVIWEALRDEIHSRLQRHGQSNMPALHREASELAHLLLGRGGDALAEASAEACPEPKSIAALATKLKGGGKKKGKKAPAKKKRAKKVAAKKKPVRRTKRKAVRRKKGRRGMIKVL